MAPKASGTNVVLKPKRATSHEPHGYEFCGPYDQSSYIY